MQPPRPAQQANLPPSWVQYARVPQMQQVLFKLVCKEHKSAANKYAVLYVVASLSYRCKAAGQARSVTKRTTPVNGLVTPCLSSCTPLLSANNSESAKDDRPALHPPIAFGGTRRCSTASPRSLCGERGACSPPSLNLLRTSAR